MVIDLSMVSIIVRFCIIIMVESLCICIWVGWVSLYVQYVCTVSILWTNRSRGMNRYAE